LFARKPVRDKQDRAWSAAKNGDVDKRHLVVERVKLPSTSMVSVSVCYGGKGRLHFLPDKAKVNGKLYCETLLLKLEKDSKSLLPFI